MSGIEDIMEEGVGFEPTEGAHASPTVFKTAAINQTLPTFPMAEEPRIELGQPGVGRLSRALRYHYATPPKWSTDSESN